MVERQGKYEDQRGPRPGSSRPFARDTGIMAWCLRILLSEVIYVLLEAYH